MIEIHDEKEKEQKKTMTTVMSSVWLLGNDSIHIIGMFNMLHTCTSAPENQSSRAIRNKRNAILLFQLLRM